jgi:hypothetical protein
VWQRKQSKHPFSSQKQIAEVAKQKEQIKEVNQVKQG